MRVWYNSAMKRMFLLIALVAHFVAAARDGEDLPLSPAHRAFLSQGIVAYVSWGPGTYLEGRSENTGSIPPDSIVLAKPDVDQWVSVLKAGGIKAAVLVAKGDDGFCLWPSRLGDSYSTCSISGALAGADVVAAFARACRRQSVTPGLSLSTWDRHVASFGDRSYMWFLMAQWDEALASAGGGLAIAGVGAGLGGRGWYGGARDGRGESRRMKAEDFPAAAFAERIAVENPLAVVSGRRGMGTVERSSGSRAEATDGWRFAQRRTNGDVAFTVQEVFVPLRKSVFFRAEEPPKSLDALVDAYFDTVGRSAVLALGVAPDRVGRIAAEDARLIKAFGTFVRTFEATDFARGSMVGAFVGGGRESGVIATLGGPRTVDAVDFGEDLSKGQVADGWTVEVHVAGEWKRVASGRSVGWRRIARFDPVVTTRVRVTCRGDGLAKIVRFAVRKIPETGLAPSRKAERRL